MFVEDGSLGRKKKNMGSPPEKGWEKKKKNPGINPGQSAGKGLGEKKKKKNPGINPGQSAEKGREKKEKKNPDI
jgi:hypothetical protein